MQYLLELPPLRNLLLQKVVAWLGSEPPLILPPPSSPNPDTTQQPSDLHWYKEAITGVRSSLFCLGIFLVLFFFKYHFWDKEKESPDISTQFFVGLTHKQGCLKWPIR